MSDLTLFDGPSLEQFDIPRLTSQLERVYRALERHSWVTLSELEQITGDPQGSISARLRDLRKSRFGAHTVERRRCSELELGTWEYRLIPSEHGLTFGPREEPAPPCPWCGGSGRDPR